MRSSITFAIILTGIYSNLASARQYDSWDHRPRSYSFEDSYARDYELNAQNENLDATEQLYNLFLEQRPFYASDSDQNVEVDWQEFVRRKASFSHLSARTNAAYYQQKGIASANECKRLADCKCPNSKVTNACINGKCKCNDVELRKIGNAFAKPILEGIKKIGDGLEKVVNDTVWALKQAIKIGSWFIPGVGKTAAKILDAAIPEKRLQTGNVKADEVLNALSKVI